MATPDKPAPFDLNSVPLSARPGLGEVNGLGDGLCAWYGAAQILFDVDLEVQRGEVVAKQTGSSLRWGM